MGTVLEYQISARLEELEERTAELSAANAALIAEMFDRQRTEKALCESEERYRRRSCELEKLHKISLSLNTLLGASNLLQVIVEQAVDLLAAPAGAVFLYDGQTDELHLMAGVGFGASSIGQTLKARDESVLRVFAGRRKVLVEDYATWSATWPAQASFDDAHAPPGYILSVPLASAKAFLGLLTVFGPTSQTFDDHDIWLVELFAAQASVALENAHLHAEAQRRANELAALNKASQAIVSKLNLESVLEVVITETRNLLAAEGASVILRDPATNELFFASVVGPGAAELIGTRMPISEGVAGWVVKERKSVLINNTDGEPRHYEGIDAKSGLTTRSIAAAPLDVRGATWGVVEVINKTEGAFNGHDLELLEALTSSAAIAFENSRLYQVEREQIHRLQESQARLIQAEKMSAMGRLTSSIAHEINNPLQAVRTCLSLIEAELCKDVDADEIRQDLKIAGEEVQRISSIVRRLREFYRPAREGTYPTDLGEVLDSVLALLDKQMEDGNIVVERGWAADLPELEANPDQLKQVFVNLLLNAADAMPNGGTLHIIATLTQRDKSQDLNPEQMVSIQFADTGEGIPPRLMSRVFEPFFTTKAGGTGLGLSISYEIIKSLGGEITVYSQVGKGTSFTILLPIHNT